MSENDVQELITVDSAGESINRIGSWNDDVTLGEVRFETIFNPQSHKLEVLLHREEGPLPIVDSSGLRSMTGISPSVFNEYRDDPDLIQRMLVHSQQKRATDIVRFNGIADRVLTVTSPKGQWIDPRLVFDLIVETINPIGLQTASVNRRKLHMRFVAQHNVDRPKKKGDIVHSGLAAKMNGSCEIGPYCYRMVCSNGIMGFSEKLRTVELAEMVQTELRNICQTGNHRSQELVEGLMHLDTVPVNHPEQVVVRVARQFNWPGRFELSVIQRLPRLEEDPTMYDLVNIATEIARDTKNNDKLLTRLGEMVFVLAAENGHRCSHCGEVLSIDTE